MEISKKQGQMAGKYNKNIEIQLMRIISIALVVMAHQASLRTNIHPHFGESLGAVLRPWLGVDIFFVISGYFMGYMVLGKSKPNMELAEKVSFSLDFFRKRFLRLFPAAFFWITVTLTAGLISSDRGLWGDQTSLFYKWLTSIFYIRNFENAVSPSPLGWYWSLSLENQFYIVLPLLFFTIGKKFFIFCIYALAMVLLFWLPGGVDWGWYRPTGFIWGLIAYHLVNTQGIGDIIRAKAPQIPATLSFFLLIFGLVASTAIPAAFQNQMMPFSISIVSILACVCVVYAALKCGTLTVPKPLVFLSYWGGEITYSFYLCHIVVWDIMQDIRQSYGLRISSELFAVSGICMAILFATLSYFFIELPFYRKKSDLEPSLK
ncbi:Putative peptidoglycan O-acetyltransferase YrhL [Acetobacter pomorum DM001]|uniref:Putative peptidoglycan O-acetyltransferase YrhL n=3 Tax=Acetobacteraceae TaxID=433 RepID=F1YV68_9PROT|nr:Putative peptidoglycan O-acetyltransferase YrhL [Acetobacter pomorum DM001]